MIRANVPTTIETQIKTLLEVATTNWELCDFQKVESYLLKAWSLLPEPRLSWDYHPQILSRRLMNCYVQLHDSANAQKWMKTIREAYDAPHLGDDPSVDFWEAQMNFELGAQEKAFEAFHCLYKKFKKRAFKGHDSKYLQFYFSNLKK